MSLSDLCLEILSKIPNIDDILREEISLEDYSTLTPSAYTSLRGTVFGTVSEAGPVILPFIDPSDKFLLVHDPNVDGSLPPSRYYHLSDDFVERIASGELSTLSYYCPTGKGIFESSISEFSSFLEELDRYYGLNNN